MLDRFYKRFGDDIIVYHSHLTPQQRYIQYMRAKNQEASIAIGTRSAIFLPFENLGCIILDEEHDSSFNKTKHRSTMPGISPFTAVKRLNVQ
jgi:primosomal protein N' (replication factor Y) (superfamily II helicase)